MSISRRTLFACVTGACAAGWSRTLAATNRLAMVTASREGPHAIAMEGIHTALGARSGTAASFGLPADEAMLRQELNSGTIQLAIGVGVEAVRTVWSVNSRVPLVATMVFRTDLARLRTAEAADIKLAGAVWLDLSIATIATGLRSVFPSVARLAVVRNSSEPDAGDGVDVSGQLPAGISVQTVRCGGTPELLASLRKLRGQVEFVICLPDSKLYNKATVEPLILASLEHKLPLVGYSASFVRAGAAVGVYPDFTEVGRQTAVLAERCLANLSTMHEETPRRTGVAVNERVLHLLGRDFRPGRDSGVTVIR